MLEERFHLTPLPAVATQFEGEKHKTSHTDAFSFGGGGRGGLAQKHKHSPHSLPLAVTATGEDGNQAGNEL